LAAGDVVARSLQGFEEWQPGLRNLPPLALFHFFRRRSAGEGLNKGQHRSTHDMKARVALFLLLSLAAPAMGAHEIVTLGPYQVSFDVNTTGEYQITPEDPSSGVTPEGVSFVRYNLSIDGEEGFAFLVLTDYNYSMRSGIKVEQSVLEGPLEATGCQDPKLYQPLIDGHAGMLVNCKYPSGGIMTVASYSPDAVPLETGEVRSKLNCRVLSVYPWETTKDMLYTLHVQAAR
jgi:hypothetical protein